MNFPWILHSSRGKFSNFKMLFNKCSMALNIMVFKKLYFWSMSSFFILSGHFCLLTASIDTSNNSYTSGIWYVLFMSQSRDYESLLVTQINKKANLIFLLYFRDILSTDSLLWSRMKIITNRLGPTQWLFPYTEKHCDHLFNFVTIEYSKFSERIFRDYTSTKYVNKALLLSLFGFRSYKKANKM